MCFVSDGETSSTAGCQRKEKEERKSTYEMKQKKGERRRGGRERRREGKGRERGRRRTSRQKRSNRMLELSLAHFFLIVMTGKEEGMCQELVTGSESFSDLANRVCDEKEREREAKIIKKGVAVKNL